MSEQVLEVAVYTVTEPRSLVDRHGEAQLVQVGWLPERD